MRNRPNECLSDDLTSLGRRGQRAAPERRCILTGETHPARDLVRLAISADGSVMPDVRAKAPGRGAWITPSRALLDQAGGKGLRAALARSFKSGGLTVPDNIVQLVETQLRQATLDRLGLEARASNLLTGMEKIEAALRNGRVDLLLHAADSGDDGRSRLAQALRVGTGREASGDKGVVLPVGREDLSMALGRQNAVHAAILGKSAADRVQEHLARWLKFTNSPMQPLHAAG